VLTRPKSNRFVDHLLEKACARNTPAELHYEQNDGQVISCRTRLLKLLSDRILVESPSQAEELLRIPAESPIGVHLLLNGTRFEFTSAILEANLKARLNRHTLVRALALRRPTEVRESQRRSSYRMTLAAKAMPVTLAPPHREVPSACDPRGPVIRARLANLSAGGLAVLADGTDKPLLEVNRQLYLTFEFPDEPEAFNMLVEVRHVQMIGASGYVKAGMAFIPWEGSNLKTESLRIARFITRIERKVLRRAR
jgi:c-di-GMP-binding flagellar brake protein YcgR